MIIKIIFLLNIKFLVLKVDLKLIERFQLQKKEILLKGFFDQKYGICKPTLNVAYNREYLIKDDVRITMDTNIDYSYFKKKQKIKNINIVVELKSSIKKDIDELFNQFPFQEIRFSKYCNGIEILNLY